MNSRTFLTRQTAGTWASAVALALGACGGGEDTSVSSIDTPPRAHASDLLRASSASTCPAANALQGLCAQPKAFSLAQSESEVIE